MPAVKGGSGDSKRAFFSQLFTDAKTKKNTFFEKQTGEAIENKGSVTKNEPERTGKRSGEVVENTCLWKKRTENEPENEQRHVAKNRRRRKNEPKMPTELVMRR
jgi:hypothetical protein